MRHTVYGLEWDLDDDPKRGQLGLIQENHYRKLFETGTSFQEDDIWLDIGANLGAFALRAAPLVKRVVAVEPDNENFLQLAHHILINGMVDKIEVIAAAVVGGDQETVPLSLSNTYTSTHRVGKVRGRKTVNVIALNINTLLQHYAVNKIKMDCEGSEVEILEALDWKGIEEIVFEYHFSYIGGDAWDRYFAILETMKELGFKILRGTTTKSKTWHTIVWARRE
jgi:FkbM family methyltransferase